MEIREFEIKNFKGINSCILELESAGAGRMITLIGLNESGKTTILEAISNFISEDEDLSSLVGTRKPEGYTRNFVPKNKKANFTGTIELRAKVALSPHDKAALSKFFLDEHSLILDEEALPETFPVAKIYKFKNSEPEASTNTWHINFSLKTKTQKKFRVYYGGADDPTRPIWLAGVRFVGERLPRICYFPTFLFEVPDKIYLEEVDGEDGEGRFLFFLTTMLLGGRRKNDTSKNF